MFSDDSDQTKQTSLGAHHFIGFVMLWLNCGSYFMYKTLFYAQSSLFQSRLAMTRVAMKKTLICNRTTSYLREELIFEPRHVISNNVAF